MLHIIEKLQGKPEGSRKRIAFFTSAFFVFILGIVWLSTFTSRMGEENLAQEKESNSPLAAVWSGITEVKEGITNMVKGVGHYEAEND